MNKTCLKYVFLNFLDHPRGNLILKKLIDNGFPPQLVVNEDSKLAEKGREFIDSFIESKVYINELISAHNINSVNVKNINDELCISSIQSAAPEYIILGDTRIIKESILKMSHKGIINSHPGYLPLVRGNNPYIWAILNDIPQGCSVHFVDQDIDTGFILKRRILELNQDDSFKDLIRKINEMCALLVLEVMLDISESRNVSSDKSRYEQKGPSNYYTKASDVQVNRAINKFNSTNGYIFKQI
ncbi:formyltransferase family protein [Cysteiniphilum sp. 19S12-1]|uniref:formyltransferase family protein n=1 Tax=Cysteiniphilum sp. 19S12-1 TaxID=3453130 RepID=UPI003F82F44C